MCDALKGLAKCLFIIFNLLFLLVGGALLGVGIWVLVDNSSLLLLTRVTDKVGAEHMDIPSLLESVVYVLIALGAVIFVMSLLGCLGACCKWNLVLKIYTGIVIVIILIQVVAIILAAVFKTKIKNEATTFLNGTMPTVYKGPYDTSDAKSLSLDSAHVVLECCGIVSPDDFAFYQNFNKTWMGTNNAVIPFTCCASTAKDKFPADVLAYAAGIDSTCPTTKTASYTVGCIDKLFQLFDQYLVVVIAVPAVVIAIEILLVVFACCLAREDDDKVV